MTTRQEKVNSLIQREIGQYFLDEPLDELIGVLTIIAVSTSPDLDEAKVYYSVVGQDPDEVEKILQKRIYEIQGALNRKLQMRKVPRIRFLNDMSGEYAQHLREVINTLHHNDSAD